ncbi:MAG: DUF5067 domain-containing protein [Clostridia bacterium]|nr:DUF5067 domain-containing protein [Clostridia bacterium]
MKKILAILLAAAMAIGMSACGKTGKVTESDMNAIEGEALGEVAEKTAEETADKTADEGKKLDEAENTEDDTSDDKPKSAASIDEFDIAIGSAKLIDSEDGRAIVVEFTFKNNTTHQKSFDGIFSETVTQGEKTLFGATVIEKIAGYDPLSATTMIEGGDTATVQKAFALNDETTDVTVTAYRYEEPERGTVTKTFKLSK